MNQQDTNACDCEICSSTSTDLEFTGIIERRYTLFTQEQFDDINNAWNGQVNTMRLVEGEYLNGGMIIVNDGEPTWH